jgi:predicted PurR-regulated permease PerM
MTPAERNRLVTRAVVTSLVGIATIGLLYLLREVLLTLYVSVVLAIGLSPTVRWIERRRFARTRTRVPRWVAILSIYLALLVIAGVVVGVTMPPLAAQVRQLVQNMPTYLDRLQAVAVGWGVLDQRWSWSSLVQNIEVPGLAITGLFGAVQGLVAATGQAVTILLLPFYLLLESRSLHTSLLKLVRPERREVIDRVARAVTVKVGAWLGGQVLLGIIMGTAVTVGLWLIGVPYFYVLGLLAAFGGLIPVVGPLLSAVPAVLLALTVSLQTAVVVTAYFGALQFLENNFLTPRIMERQVGISPVTLVIALLAGSSLLGLPGAILAVPSAAIVQVLAQEFLAHD